MTQYPEALKLQMRRSTTPVFAQDFATAQVGDCPNCGGLGNVYVFITERGPFRDVPGAGRNTDSVLKSVEDPMYGWVWYIGQTVGASCPACRGSGRAPRQPRQMESHNTAGPVHQLVERFGR